MLLFGHQFLFIFCLWLALTIRAAFTCRDKIFQTMLDIVGPCIPADIKTFIVWYETDLCHAELRFSILFRNVKNNMVAGPFSFVFGELEIIVEHEPNHFFCRNYFYQ